MRVACNLRRSSPFLVFLKAIFMHETHALSYIPHGSNLDAVYGLKNWNEENLGRLHSAPRR